MTITLIVLLPSCCGLFQVTHQHHFRRCRQDSIILEIAGNTKIVHINISIILDVNEYNFSAVDADQSGRILLDQQHLACLGLPVGCQTIEIDTGRHRLSAIVVTVPGYYVFDPSLIMSIDQSAYFLPQHIVDRE